jgi:ketosteroid isomerase-like protein
MLRLLFFLAPLAALAQSTDEQLIRKASVQFSADYVRGDFAAMANHYTEEGLVMAPGRDAMTGKAAILEFWKTTTVPMKHESVSEKIVIEGSTAHDYGYFYVQTQKPGESAGALNSAKYYIQWRKGTDGQWRMAVDMWNSRQAGWKR